MNNILKRMFVDYCAAFMYILLAYQVTTYTNHEFLSVMIIFLAGWLCHITQQWLRTGKSND